jgi:hypothetical protein
VLYQAAVATIGLRASPAQAPAPDVVVIPAVAVPNGKKEAPLREWIARQANRGAHFLACAPAQAAGRRGPA